MPAHVKVSGLEGFMSRLAGDMYTCMNNNYYFDKYMRLLTIVYGIFTFGYQWITKYHANSHQGLIIIMSCHAECIFHPNCTTMF